MGFILDLASLLYIIVYAVSGYFVAKLVVPNDRTVKQFFFGLVTGLIMLLWFPVMFAFLIDFTLTAQLLALGLCVGIGVLCFILGKKRPAPLNKKSFSLKDERTLLLTTVPLMLIGIILICNHYITNASDGSLHVGQSAYGDLAMHLGFITSISVQESFPPMYSIMPDTPLGYPFLCDSISSTFYTLGASLRFAAILPAIFAYIIVVLGVYLFFEQWFKRNSVTVLATLLFFIGGGFGFAYIFDNSQTLGGMLTEYDWENWLQETYHITADVTSSAPLDRWQQLLGGWYETPTNFIELGMRWVNPICDMLVPQRATLFGWALLFPALQLLYRAAIENERRLFIALGIIGGAMPLVHTHSFFALGLMSAFLLVALIVRAFYGNSKAKTSLDRDLFAERKRTILYFLIFGVIAVLLAAPQLFGFTFKQATSGSFIKSHFNWCNESDGWLWFYIKNLGLIFILMPMAFLSTKKENKLFYGGALLIWAISEFLVFQPNPYDNNKLLFVWFALTCGIVAEYLMALHDRIVDGGSGKKRADERVKKLVPLGKRVAQRLLCAVVLITLFLSGTLTIIREYVSGDHFGTIKNSDGTQTIGYSENGYQLVSSSLVELTEFINENVEKDATFLTATNHNNAIAMLTGRNIVCGAGTFLAFHGVDYAGRQANVKLMYEQPDIYFDQYAAEYDVDYVLISSWERGSYNIDNDYFSRFEIIFQNSGATLYKVG